MASHSLFKPGNLSRDETEAILRACHAVCKEWWMDKLDMRHSARREKVPFTFEMAMDRWNENSIAQCTWRPRENYFDVGFRSMTDPVDFFLFMVVAPDAMAKIIKQFSLTV